MYVLGKHMYMYIYMGFAVMLMCMYMNVTCYIVHEEIRPAKLTHMQG